MGLAILWLGCARSGFDLVVRDSGSDATWYDLGGSAMGAWGERTGGGSAWGSGIGFGGFPSITLTTEGDPVVAWTDGRIQVKRFDGAAWVELGAGSASDGGISNSTFAAGAPSLALDSSNRPVVSWQDSSTGTPQVYVKRFDGTAWVELGVGSASDGGISNSTFASSAPSMVLDSQGNPTVAWSDLRTVMYQIYVRRFDGIAWVEVGAGSTSGGGVSNTASTSKNPSLALNAAGHPVVAWETSSSGNGEIYVKRFDGLSWVAVGSGSATGGGVSGTAGYSGWASLATNSTGDPIVAWEDDTSGHTEIYSKRFDGVAWVEVGAGSASGGGISNTSGEVRSMSIAVDGSDHPVLAWQDDHGLADILVVKRFDGTSWTEVGSGSVSGGEVDNSESTSDPSLALDAAGNPVLAWSTALAGLRWLTPGFIYVKRFDGSSWEGLAAGTGAMPAGGGISNTATPSEMPSLLLDSSGLPVVAWTEDARDVYVKHFDGTNWAEMGTSSASGSGISGDGGVSVSSWSSSTALDSADRLVVAWADRSSGNDEIYVKRFDGTTWVEMGISSASGGGVSNTAGYSGSPALAVDSSGRPVMAWTDDTSGNDEIYVKRFDGTNWVEMGIGSASGGGVSSTAGLSGSPSLAVSGSGHALVAWTDGPNIYVKHFDGTAWAEMGIGSASGGGVSNTAGDTRSPALALDSSERPVVAWADNTSGNVEIYVKRFDGANWVQVGGDAVSGCSVSNGANLFWRLSLALDSSGRPVVAWADDTSGNDEIYIKRFDGTAWVAIGVDSASGGGISNSEGPSWSPSVAINGNVACVAWSEPNRVALQIVMRCARLP